MTAGANRDDVHKPLYQGDFLAVTKELRGLLAHMSADCARLATSVPGLHASSAVVLALASDYF